ncbi:MAG: hypothetical protein WC708_11315 [Lentisphaeria bacterium]
MLSGKVVRIRWVKMYPSAHNHVAIGNVLQETPYYLTLLCKTYHFGHGAGTRKAFLAPNTYVGGIVEGEKAIRSIPWSQIEVINELPAETDWNVRALVEESGLCTLVNAHKTVITRAMNIRQE